MDLTTLKVKLFADGADLEGIREMASNPLIKGFTTNPTLMRRAGVLDYKTFALKALEIVSSRPISFEVFSDDFGEMITQTLEIASWGHNVYVKVPVTNTKGDFSGEIIRDLSRRGIKLNVTAVMTREQVEMVRDCLDPQTPAIISIFAGRIADTGVDPVSIMSGAVWVTRHCPNIELIWASPRELLNVFQANAVGCHIITATNDILKKLSLVGKDLNEYSLETVQMFHQDAKTAGYRIG